MSVNSTDVETIFNAALQKGSTAERFAYLDGACGSDAELRGRLEALLRAHEEAGSFLDAPPDDPDATAESLRLAEGPGTTIGPYKLLQRIGEGGFGLVYMAEQQEPVRRKVALKVIKLGMDTRQVIARFEAERQALAMMDHPNIAKVLDAGATETGRPYFVMELVKGIPITEYCDRNRLSTRQRLELFVPVCRAIQHAHQKGIIHRDVKPNNVLVTLHDSEPVPKVIDFGVAKATSQRLTEKTLFTGFRQFIGTPEYMSPDQAEMSGLDVDTRTDIYSLGVLLYELLTGKTPFDAKTLREAGYSEIQRIIREVDPLKPSTRLSTLQEELADIALHRRAEPDALSRLMRGDLDWIVMKAMEKDRTRRYETASEMAGDIQRHLKNEPVLAGPPSAAYRLRKFIRRHQVGMVAGSFAAAALLIGFSLATLGFIQATRAKVAAQVERDAAQTARAEAEQAQLGEQAHRRLAEASAETAQKEAVRSATLAAFMQEMLGSVDPGTARGREVTFRYVLDDAARRIDEGALQEQPQVEAAVRLTLGDTYKSLGLYAPAEMQLRAAETTRARLFGDEDPETLQARSRLAGLYSAQGRYAEAETLHRQTLETQRRVLGEEHPDTLASMNGLGIAIWKQGRFAEAETIHRRTLELQRRVLGEEHLETLRSMVNVGTVLWLQEKRAEAEAYQRQTLETLHRVLGEEHLETLRAMNNLGLVLWSVGKVSEAETMYRRALEILHRVYGDEHPNTLKSMTNLSALLADQGKYAEAEVLNRRTLEILRRVLGDDHPDTRLSRANLLNLLKAQGKWDEMRPFVEEQIAARKQRAEQPDVDARALNEYAWVLLTCDFEDLRDPHAALPVAERAVELDGGRNAYILDTLAVAYQMTGDIERAVATQRRAVACAQSGKAYNVAGLEARLAGLLWEKGDALAAGRVYGDCLSRRLAKRAALGSVPDEARFLTACGLVEQHKYADAEPVLRQCLAARTKALPPSHWLIAQVQSVLGAALAEQKKFGEAEPLLLQGYAGLMDAPKVSESERRQAVQRVIDLYEAWGRPDQAAEWRSRLPVIDPVPAANPK